MSHKRIDAFLKKKEIVNPFSSVNLSEKNKHVSLYSILFILYCKGSPSFFGGRRVKVDLLPSAVLIEFAAFRVSVIFIFIFTRGYKMIKSVIGIVIQILLQKETTKGKQFSLEQGLSSGSYELPKKKKKESLLRHLLWIA